jgi:hypothetical protein
MTSDFDHSQATVVFVLGLVGLLACQLLGPVALILGNKYRRECALAGEAPQGLGTAGWVLGIIGTVYFCILLLVALLYIVFLVLFVGLAFISSM